MSQARPEDKMQENLEITTKRDEKREISSPKSFKFNAQAPEFVPCSHTQSPVSGYFYPYFNCLGMGGHDGSGSADWIYAGLGDQDQQMHIFTNPNVLIGSNDGKKVRRKYPFTEKDKEELQSRTVVDENLLEDHFLQNLEKIYSIVGSVKAIRICHPPEPNSSHSNGDCVFSNKLHALVEYESTEIAEKAVDKLKDERKWRKGFRVRLLIRRSVCDRCQSVQKTKKWDFDGLLDDDDDFDLSKGSSQPTSATSEPVIDNNGVESSKKGWAQGRRKSKSCTPTHGTLGLLVTSPQASQASPTKHSPKGPRMPGGTRGFTMGRGKPILTGIP